MIGNYIRGCDLRVVLFSATLFLSASLMFVIEPMIGKMMLPLVGGSPSGWLIAIAYFQLALVLGYFLAYLLQRFTVRLHVGLVCLIFLAGISFLPPDIKTDFLASDNFPEALKVFLSLGARLTLPFVALAMVSSSLQRLFSVGPSTTAKDPYFLFASSNLGSFCGLLSYPLWFERVSGLSFQASLWQEGYLILLGLIGICLCLTPSRDVKDHFPGTEPDNTILWSTRGTWILLAFIPSSLMLGITAYITEDIGAVPLFWVFPLSLYLLTFVLAFSGQSPKLAKSLTFLHPLAVALLILVFVRRPTLNLSLYGRLGYMALPLSAFFLIAFFCHSLLAASRPNVRRLTEYYLWIAIGGALGGMFNAFIVPLIFPQPIEFIVISLLSCTVSPTLRSLQDKKSRTLIWSLLVFALVISFKYAFDKKDHEFAVPGSPFFVSFVFLVTMIIGCLTNLGANASRQANGRWEIFAAGITMIGILSLRTFPGFQENLMSYVPDFLPGILSALLLCFVYFYPRSSTLMPFIPLTVAVFILGMLVLPDQNASPLLEIKRNFFGILRVYDKPQHGKTIRYIYHGSTVHGVQQVYPEIDTQPASYYISSGPVGDIMTVSHPSNVGVIGLGSGAITCFIEADRHFTFYEIDPDVVDIASTWFNYFHDCGLPKIEIGDGRQLLFHDHDARYDLLIVDAFTSDAIPFHLLTEEAIHLYSEHLKPDGILLSQP